MVTLEFCRFVCREARERYFWCRKQEKSRHRRNRWKEEGRGRRREEKEYSSSRVRLRKAHYDAYLYFRGGAAGRTSKGLLSPPLIIFSKAM